MANIPLYLALGSNLGDRRENLVNAISQLSAQVRVERISSVYETEPAYVSDQPRFLNIVLAGSTTLAPETLLRFVKSIEHGMGRVAGTRYGPRPIDIDILAYGDDQIDLPSLAVPHPRIAERSFVLEPLAELAPDLMLAGQHEPVASLAQRLGRAGIVAVTPHLLRTSSLTIGSKTFRWGSQTYLMGILNVTPDSFSGDSVLKAEDWIAAAATRAQELEQAGADMIDIGGESTRPGHQPVPLEEELRRVLPVVRAVADAVTVPISIDTSKATVASAALDAGATIINDVWGGKRDPEMVRVAARSGAPIVLMHNRAVAPDKAHYDDLLGEVGRELQESIDLALDAGVAPNHIIADPGIGFGKSFQHNYELIDRMRELHALGYPLLVGPSRKGFTGRALNLPPDQRGEGTAAAVALLIDRGADIVRVHDVAAMLRVARVADAITRREEVFG